MRRFRFGFSTLLTSALGILGTAYTTNVNAQTPTPQPEALPPASSPTPIPSAPADASMSMTSASPMMAVEGSSSAPTTTAASTSTEHAAHKHHHHREHMIHELPTPWGPTGLLHLPTAMTGAPYTFRVGFFLDWFGSSSFLCTSKYPCGTSQSDNHSHIGGSGVISATLFKGFETYIAARVYANSNDQARPQLLQVLGDVTLGAKYVRAIGSGLVNVGGQLDLMFLNASGNVGISGKGTSGRLRALSTFALDKLPKPLPLRFHLGFGYLLDNSSQIVSDVEDRRTAAAGSRQQITRLERYGLGINRMDRLEIGVGVEGLLAHDKVRPFLEYNFGIPVNRQDYVCPRPTPGSDGCLLNEGFSSIPSKLSLGAKVHPFEKGLRGLGFVAALDIGITGTSTFVHELASQAPYTLWLGVALATDPSEKPPKTVEKVVMQTVEKPSNLPALVKVRGLVHEQGNTTPIANAIVSYVGAELHPLATGHNGVFGDEVAFGQYRYSIRAEGYKDGICEFSYTKANMGSPSPATAEVPPEQPTVQVDCALEALPRVGSARISLVNADTQKPATGVTVVLTDSNGGNERKLNADAGGAVSIDNLAPGTWFIHVEGEGFMHTKHGFEIKARQETKEIVNVRARPKKSLVSVEKTEIKIKQQVHFATNQAVILGDSISLLEEVADALIRTPRLKRMEIQGHTDNQGGKERNLTLSKERAEAVKTFLVRAGVDASRLDTKGYGDTKPVSPNITEAGRAKNRRVQFVILEQDPAKNN